MSRNEWTKAAHAEEYLSRADRIPHRAEGEAALLDEIPLDVRRILDIGTGDGRLLALLRTDRPAAACVGLDFSPAMLAAARERFADDTNVRILDHDFDTPLVALGGFEAVVSSFAIHHATNDRKRALYAEIFDSLNPGGVFCNLEHVDSPTENLHLRYLAAIGTRIEDEDPSNKLVDVQSQLTWLREIGFCDVDCLWKWREFALLTGRKPVNREEQLTANTLC